MTNQNFKRLIVVSNRLPVTFAVKKGKVTVTSSSGGLVSCLKSYIEKLHEQHNETEVLWVGSCDVPRDKFEQHFKAEQARYDDYTLCPVYLPAETQDRHYNGLCNATIWPLFHYFPSITRYSEEEYRHYQKANALFAEKIMQVYQPGDVIWVHDYHLMLLPAMLRKNNPSLSIGFFLHIPFPSFEVFRLLPSQWRKEILEGLLGSDLVGFHTNDYVLHFLQSVKHLLGYDHAMRTIVTPQRSITAEVFPVSIDYKKFSQAHRETTTIQALQNIRQNIQAKTIVSVDRLDYSKGLVNRLESFEQLLEQYPERRGHVSYVMVVVPSRDIIARYRENKREIEQTVSRINGKYGSIGYTPVIYQYRSLGFDELTALYLAADVALITPARDGMNLVAKEFIATWQDGKGVLILSETAGAAAELGEALVVNPTDRYETAAAIQAALDMPLNEQASRNRLMQQRLQTYDVTKWAEDFMESLQQSKRSQEKMSVNEISGRTESSIRNKYEQAGKRLLLFDYDGTLVPFARKPELAVPGKDLLKLLNSLAQVPQNTVVIVSGRPKDTLEEWFGNLPINLVAEHGGFIKMHGGKWEKAVRTNTQWKNDVLPLLQLFTDRCPRTFTEEKLMSVAWHYRNADADLGFVRSRELVHTLSELSVQQDFQVLDGNRVVEVRSRGIDKGTAAAKWINEPGYDFIMAVGDDKTDEDMFRRIPQDGFSIRVGLVPSAAQYNFKSQQDVIVFLGRLVQAGVMAHQEK